VLLSPQLELKDSKTNLTNSKGFFVNFAVRHCRPSFLPSHSLPQTDTPFSDDAEVMTVFAFAFTVKARATLLERIANDRYAFNFNTSGPSLPSPSLLTARRRSSRIGCVPLQQAVQAAVRRAPRRRHVSFRQGQSRLSPIPPDSGRLTILIA
jgi:hypothetical protein